MRRIFFLFSLLAISALNSSAQNPGLYFPPKTGPAWSTLAPADLGFCPERIDSLYTFLEAHDTKSFLLLQDGKIVLEKYFGTFTQDSLWYWASAGKSLTAFLVGQAQEEGLLDLDDPVADYLGAGWTACTPDQENAITIRHQLTMTTGFDDNVPDDNCTDPGCLQCLAAPGARWAYHNAPYRLIHDVLAEASGVNINLFTKNRLFDRTGMKGFWLDHIMYGRARDMARFGLLMLAGGEWDGDTLLHDAAYLQAMPTPSQDLNKSYGYLWWLNGQPSFMLPGLQFAFPGPLLPNAPADLYAALGKNDQKIHVVPSKGWVVVRQGNAAGFNGPNGGQVPIVFDDQLWVRLNALVCAPSGITFPDDREEGIRISPNPSPDASWQVESAFPMQKIAVFDIGGRLLHTVYPQSETTARVNAGAWPAGVYRIVVDGTDGRRWIRKALTF